MMAEKIPEAYILVLDQWRLSLGRELMAMSKVIPRNLKKADSSRPFHLWTLLLGLMFGVLSMYWSAYRSVSVMMKFTSSVLRIKPTISRSVESSMFTCNSAFPVKWFGYYWTSLANYYHAIAFRSTRGTKQSKTHAVNNLIRSTWFMDRSTK